MNFHELPKVELHLHLDCSLSYDLVKKLRPGTTEEDYQQSFIAPPKCTDLADYLLRAVKGFELMQTKEALRLSVFDLFEQLQKDRVIYAEIRFAPFHHIKQGLSPETVVWEVNDAVAECVKQSGIKAGVLLCTLRHYEEARSMETVKLVKQFKGSHVVGFDIAGDEAGYPIDAHTKAFQYAKACNIPCTAHAGEARGPRSVQETVEHFQPRRIGHGVRSVESERLLAQLKERDIHLEVCPTSNIQTDIYHRLIDHSVDKIFRSGVSMSISTDCRTISDVTLTSEYQGLKNNFDWKLEHFRKCNTEAIKSAFTTESVKAQLYKQLTDGFEKFVS
ncbi:MAG: adenosine deaminase [Cyclobacteriaceae bacterium]